MRKEDTILIFIVFVALLLRMVNYTEIPFTHDEFSSLFRTYFDSFRELIEKGVKVDEHPAGGQVFWYYWTQIFGASEPVVKLPYVLFGVGSVVMIYLLGKEWFSETSGLVSAAFMASLQYPVMYSQIARPYISGMFFALILVYAWFRIINSREKLSVFYASIFVISGVFCAYNHHFSLFFAFIVGMTGIFMVERKFLLRYLILGVLIFLLYVPHLNIFFIQLSREGVGSWLGAPSFSFPLDYLGYIFHFSPWVMLTVAGLIIFGWWQGVPDNKVLNRQKLAFLWFVLPMLTGFVYSHLVDPVLQYSVLIFSFPFLLLFLFGHLKETGMKAKIICISIVLTVNILTLVYDRDHYTIFYTSPYEEIPQQHHHFAQEYGDELTSVLITSRNITRHYAAERGLDTSFYYYDSFHNPSEFNKFLEEQDSDYLYFGTLPHEDLTPYPVIREHYPYLVYRKNLWKGDIRLYSRLPDSSINDTVYHSGFDFEENALGGWQEVDAQLLVDTMAYSGERSLHIGEDMEFTPGFNKTAGKAGISRFNRIEFSAVAMFPESVSDVYMVLSVEKNGQLHKWRAVAFEDFIGGSKDEWKKGWHALWLNGPLSDPESYIIKAHIWNKGGQKFLLDDLQLTIRKGNPMVYSLTEPFSR